MLKIPTITLYGAPDCHLCDNARAEMVGLAKQFNFNLIEVDITTGEELHRHYLERIPVIALNGEELFDYKVDVEALGKVLPRREIATNNEA